MKELLTIQAQVKAPKNQNNDFGGYKYRTAAGILEAVKPHLEKLKCQLILQDEIVAVGARFYVKATVTLTNEAGESISASAYAREPELKTKMDDAQVTGASSSYARKYALCGLFAIDDSTQDPDADKIITPGCAKWKDAVEFCTKKKIQAGDLRKYGYILSEETEVELNNILGLTVPLGMEVKK